MKKNYSAPAIRCYELTQKQPLLQGASKSESIMVNSTSGNYKSQDEFLDE